MHPASAFLLPILIPLVASDAEAGGVFGLAVVTADAFAFDHVHKFSAALAAKSVRTAGVGGNAQLRNRAVLHSTRV